MKSKTSFFNGVVFRKNLTRFAPVWGLYILCLLLGMILLMDSNLEYWFAAHFAELVQIVSVVNLGYALLVAQVLFGDLYNTRMCNALHAMPMRRECWFITNVASGFFFSLLPTALLAAVSVPVIGVFSVMVNGWQLPLYWLLANSLEYCFFFGVAVFSAFCTGNRVGMALIYAIANSFSYLVCFLLNTLYIPMLHGVVLQTDVFKRLCPMVQLADTIFIECTRYQEFIGYDAKGLEQYDVYGTFALTEHWGYLWLIAAVGVGLILLALWMYRRRRLECAGDLISTKKLEPGFMVLFSMATAVIFHFVVGQVFAYRFDWKLYLFLFMGLAVGWFAGRMLLERQVTVFRRGRNWLGLMLLAGLFGMSIGLTVLDPLGIVTWVPEAEAVEQVRFGKVWRGEVKSDDPEVIADVLRLHELALEQMLTTEEISAEQAAACVWPTGPEDYEEPDYRRSGSFDICYTLNSGRVVERTYHIWLDTEAGSLLNRYTSSVEAVFSDYEQINTPRDLLDTAAVTRDIHVEGVPLPEELLTQESVESLYAAVIADCAAGTMSQYAEFHDEPVYRQGDDRLHSYSVDLFLEPVEGDSEHVGEYYYFNIYADSENCLAWLESAGILEDIWANLEEIYK